MNNDQGGNLERKSLNVYCMDKHNNMNVSGNKMRGSEWECYIVRG